MAKLKSCDDMTCCWRPDKINTFTFIKENQVVCGRLVKLGSVGHQPVGKSRGSDEKVKKKKHVFKAFT